MSSFTEPLEVRQAPDGHWVTTRAMEYHAGEYPSDEIYTVPAGFKTDFASIPRVLWTAVGHPAGRYAQAAVFHDEWYRSGRITRRRADALFLEGMDVLCVPWAVRRTLWAGVRIGGWVVWRSHRRRQANGGKELIV